MRNDWSPPLQFNKVEVVFEPWPPRWLKESKPGTLFISAGTIGTVGGLLRLTRDGLFITLSKEQAFCGALIEWPGRNAPIAGIVIDGSKIQVIDRVKKTVE